MDIAACVEMLVPGARFKGSATIPDRVDWESREWIGPGGRPSWAAIEAISPAVVARAATQDFFLKRREKYRLELEKDQAAKAGDTMTVEAIDADLAKVQ